MSGIPIPGFLTPIALLSLATIACTDRPATEQIGEKPAPTPEAPVEPAAEEPSLMVFPSAGAAIAEVLSKNDARLVGFGEFHQTEDTTHIESAVTRFTDQILPGLGPGELVVETWVKEGNCGEKEEVVHRDLDRTTERPATTETEVARLLRLARQSGIQPHILTIRCEDYDRLLGDAGEVDYWKFLKLITEGLRDKAGDLAGKAPGVDGPRRVFIYGGAIHNDKAPYEDLAPYSFAADLDRATGGSYLEVDLYVPEFIRDNPQLKTEAWYPLFEQHVSREKVLLIRRTPGSYIIIFKEGVSNEGVAGRQP